CGPNVSSSPVYRLRWSPSGRCPRDEFGRLGDLGEAGSTRWVRMARPCGCGWTGGAAPVWARAYILRRMGGSVGHMTTQRASDVMVRALENEGVERIFGIPGEENIDFLDSVRQSSIEFVLTRHEQRSEERRVREECQSGGST